MWRGSRPRSRAGSPSSPCAARCGFRPGRCNAERSAEARCPVLARRPMEGLVERSAGVLFSRGLLARNEARRTGDHVDSDTLFDGVQCRLDAARMRLARRGSGPPASPDPGAPRWSWAGSSKSRRRVSCPATAVTSPGRLWSSRFCSPASRRCSRAKVRRSLPCSPCTPPLDVSAWRSRQAVEPRSTHECRRPVHHRVGVIRRRVAERSPRPERSPSTARCLRPCC